MRWMRSGFALGTVVPALVGCGNGEPAESSPGLAELRARHPSLVTLTPAVTRVDATAGASGSAPAPPSFAARPEGGFSHAASAGAEALAVVVPATADGTLELVAEGAGLHVSVRLSGAQAVAGGAEGDFVVYPAGAGPGTTVLFRAAANGVEDFVAIERQPERAELRYELELSAEVAGLRLVDRTLELIAAGGAPELRVAPPYVLSADGARVPAALAVEGCAVDTSAAPPWGRPPLPPRDGSALGASCTLVVSWDGAGVSYPALVDPAWTSTASMSTARAYAASAQLEDGRVLVVGGSTEAGAGAGVEPLASAELYDPVSRRWAVTGALATGRRAHTLSALGGGALLAAGGEDSTGPLTSTERYDALTGTWSAGPELTSPHAGHGAARLTTGELLIAGGSASLAPTLLEADGSAFAPAGELLALEPGSTLTALEGGGALLVGPNAPSAQLFDAATRGWRSGPELLEARSHHSATRLPGGGVLVAGGDGLRSAELYDPGLERWAPVGALAAVHAEHTATPLPDGRVAVVGGLDPEGARLTELYDPAWGTWTPGPALSDARGAHVAERLPSGLVLAAGGVEPGGNAKLPSVPLAAAEELDSARLPFTITEYKLPAALDRDISAVITELWAAVARPTTLEPGRRYPVVLLLHGNHATCGTGENPRADIDCTYTEIGVCPEGFVVVPSHRGYDYLAGELAARGYIVVSVNANRGITCGGDDIDDPSMNLARGRLLLAHLARLSRWNRGLEPTPPSVGAELFGQLDLAHVGIMGHSRGGEGARAAYQQYRDPGSPWPTRIGEPVVFRGIFEIGPVDGQTFRTFNADGTAWTVLLPVCDGDVSDLQGVRPFDRMLELTTESRDTFKATYTAWGTNHNFFNTEWQESDSPGCLDHRPLFEQGPGITGSAEQRQIGLRSMLTFFLANVGRSANPTLNQLFDPATPAGFATRIDRGYTQGLRLERALTLEDFDGVTGRSTRGLPHLASGVDVSHQNLPEHDPALRGAVIRWASPSTDRFLELRLSSAASGIDLSRYTHLEFRIDRAADGLNPPSPTPVLVQLAGPAGALSEPVELARYGVILDGPPSGPFNAHSMLKTARIPFAHFEGVSASGVTGVRFVFPPGDGASDSGALLLADVRATLGSAVFGRPPASPPAPFGVATRPAPSATPKAGGRAPLGAPIPPQVNVAGNRVLALRVTDTGQIELELEAGRAFKAQDDLLVLEVAAQRIARAHHPSGNLQRVVFTLDASEFIAAPDGAALAVRYASNEAVRWDFGALDKSLLAP